MIEVERVVQKIEKVEITADTMVVQCEIKSPVSTVGIPSKRIAR